MKIINAFKRQKRKTGLINTFIYVIGSGIHKLVIALFKRLVLPFCRMDENKILFTSSPDFSDNSKILYEYICCNKPKYICRWIVGENKGSYSDKTVFVEGRSKYHSGYTMRALKEIAASKYIFFTHSSPVYELGKRKGQIVINLWHGCGYKNRTSNVPWISKNPFDYVLVPGPVFIDAKSRFFGCSSEQVLPIGYPRYDLFYKESKEAVDFADVLKQGNQKLVLWMPTYRKTISGIFDVEKIEGYFELPILKSEEELERLNAFCKQQQIMLCIKRHPQQIKYQCEDMKLSNVVFLSNEDFDKNNTEIYSFLQYINGLITDYSSIAIDYILLDKPMAFTLNDMEDYRDAQGFVFDDPLTYMPGHHLYNYDDVISFLTDIQTNKDIYRSNRTEIFKEVHNTCENYCKRICDHFEL